MKEKRNSLKDEEKLLLAQKIFANFKTSIKLSQHNLKIAGYYAINNEPDINNILAYLAQAGHKILLPYVDLKKMQFKESSPAPLKQNSFFPFLFEPSGSLMPEVPDVIIAPLLAADLNGNRIGYGKGFYDKTVKQLRSENNLLYIGICYDFQLTQKIEPEIHDQALDIIITENKIVIKKEVGF